MTEFSIIRVPISGEWWAYEMAGFIDAVDELYADIAIISTARQLAELGVQNSSENLLLRTRAEHLRSIVLRGGGASSEFLRGDDFEIEAEYKLVQTAPLQVLSAQYGSDGNFDFLGIGKLAEALASIYNKAIDAITGRHTRQTEELANIKQKLEIAKLTGLPEDQLQAYAAELLAKHDRTFRRLAKQEPLRLPKPMVLLPAPASIPEQRKPPN